MWMQMGDDFSEEESYQAHKKLYDAFVANRNVNEAEVFDKVNLLNEEFKKLQARLKKYYSRKDPGSSGDIVEIEISKLLLKLFPQYKILTKGIIRDAQGNLSPQIDVLILDQDYPLELLSGNTVSAESVLFAIECKLTLRKKELIKSVKTASYLKSLGGVSINHLAKKQIKYGIFALSSEVIEKGKTGEEAVLDIIVENSNPNNPLQLIDFVCVPNSYSIYVDVYACDDPNLENPDFLYYIGQFEAHALNYPYEYPNDEPLGNFIYKTLKVMNRITNTKSNWIESNFGVFNTVSSYESNTFYQRLTENEVNSILDRSVNEHNSKIKLCLGRSYKKRHKLKIEF